MPSTARKHFDEDLSRARAIHALDCRPPHRRADTALVRDDLLRSAWMFGVGALDAYFCDAYADLLARTLQAKNRQPTLKLTSAISSIDLPVGAIFSPTSVRVNWRWRLAARGLMEKDNVLSISKIQQLLNPFLSNGNKLFEAAVIDLLIRDYNAPQRLVGVRRDRYGALSGNDLSNARKLAREKIVDRINNVCQRRHDCIHNCDRPKMALQPITEVACRKALDDIELLVHFCDRHIELEYNKYLRTV
ncbi:MAG: hypothetical protein MN733_08270, partial [Nitrososphaera sp.]|nr:hypothetical protein [Nitrososphaera sp.]